MNERTLGAPQLWRDLAPPHDAVARQYVISLTQADDKEPGGEGPDSVLGWLNLHPHNAAGGFDDRGLFATFVWFDPETGRFMASITICAEDRDARERHKLTGKGFFGFFQIGREFRRSLWLPKAVAAFALAHIEAWVARTGESVEFYAFTPRKNAAVLKRAGFSPVEGAKGAAGFEEDLIFIRRFAPTLA